jgi:hypothetical protein
LGWKGWSWRDGGASAQKSCSWKPQIWHMNRLPAPYSLQPMHMNRYGKSNGASRCSGWLKCTISPSPSPPPSSASFCWLVSGRSASSESGSLPLRFLGFMDAHLPLMSLDLPVGFGTFELQHSGCVFNRPYKEGQKP